MKRLIAVRLLLLIELVGTTLVLSASLLRAQAPAQPETQASDSVQRLGEHHIKRMGRVELHTGDTSIFADEADLYDDEHRAVLAGNVVLTQGTNRIAAERAEFDTETRLGTFYNAYGIASLQPTRSRQSRTAAFAPPTQAGQETDVYFYGDTVEKIGPKKYKITNGGFSTCVQPTPRWQLSSKTVILNVDHYTVLRQAVFTVKGVPMLYTPILYYPTNREDRATGILIPTYGTSTVRGQSIHNAFFWAINRSQDMTFMHDWFTSTGQGFGNEYRYNYGGGSDGEMRAYLLKENETTLVGPNGATTTLPGERSYEIRGNVNQPLPHGFRARARANYFSSLATMQTLNTNIYDASRNQRSFGGNIVGVVNGFSVNGTLDHSEYFYPGSLSSAVTGNWPRVNVSRNERPFLGSNLYYSVSSEYAGLLRTNKTGTIEDDSGLTRLDLYPQIRYPFKRWQWFTVNSTVSWRDTFYTRSRDPATGQVVSDSLNRTFFEFRSQLLGPVFTRIWNTPENGYAEKFKHSIEPFFNIQRTSAIDDYDRVVKLDSTDYIVGGTTQYNYGVTNRFYAKRREGARAQAREILDVQIDQTYYTNALASQYDTRYATSFTGASPNPFSPVALSVRGIPTNDLNFTVRAEFDSTYRSMRTISAGGTYSWTGRVQT